MWAKQSTAATLIVGPILDSAGAEYASAVIGDLSISKNGATLTAMAAAATPTHIANGQYTLVTTTGNLDTLGRAQITCNKSTYQMPAVNLMVVPAMVFDSMVLGTDVLQADCTQIGGDTQSATDLKDFADAGYDPSTNKVQGVVLVDTITTYTGDTPQTGDAFDRIGATGSGLTSLAPAATALSTVTWPGTLATNLGTTNTTVAAMDLKIDTIDNFLDTEIAAILADTNELQTDWANGGRLDLILDIIAADTTTDIPALIAALNNISIANVSTGVTTALTTALTEGYRTANATGSVRDLLYEINQGISEFVITSTTKTVKKLDGSTTAKTYTLNDATTPTGITETT